MYYAQSSSHIVMSTYFQIFCAYFFMSEKMNKPSQIDSNTYLDITHLHIPNLLFTSQYASFIKSVSQPSYRFHNPCCISAKK